VVSSAWLHTLGPQIKPPDSLLQGLGCNSFIHLT
jgi:hypothetical protein